MKKRIRGSFFSTTIKFAAILIIFPFALGGCLQESEEIPSTGTVKEFSGPLTIPRIREKDFSSSRIEIVRTLEKNSGFTRYLIAYYSDELRITGMMNVPTGQGPFPLVILNHGRYDRRKYFIGAGFGTAADIFAGKGYVAIGSDYRNYGKSGKGRDFFAHLGSLYDVLYLLNAAKKEPFVDKGRIGMWGYSWGGWLTLKAAVIDPDIKAAALFGSMSADDAENYKRIYKWHPEIIEDVKETIGSPADSPGLYSEMSPVSFLKDMPEYTIIHRGEADKVIPVEWSEQLRDRLAGENKTVEYYSYPGQGHTLEGKAWKVSMDRTVAFFNKHLRAGK